MLFFVVHRLGDLRKSAREVSASRLFCFTAGFSGSPTGLSFRRVGPAQLLCISRLVGVPCVTVTLNVVSSSRSTVRAMAMSQYSSGELLMWLRGLQPVLPASPQKPSTADRDGVPLNPPRGGFQVDHRKPELPIRIGDVTRLAPAHGE